MPGFKTCYYSRNLVFTSRVLLFGTLLLSLGSALSVYVDNQASPGGNGSVGSPFYSINEAIDSMLNADTKEIKNDTLIVRIKPTEAPYQLESINITGTAISNFSIQAWTSITVTSQDQCGTLPILLLSSPQSSQISNLLIIQISSVFVHFNQTAQIQNPVLTLKQVQQILFSNICFRETTAALQSVGSSSPFIKVLDSGTFYCMNSVILKAFDYTWFSLNNTRLSVVNTNITLLTGNALSDQSAIFLASDDPPNQSLWVFFQNIDFTCEDSESTLLNSSTLFRFDHYLIVDLQHVSFRGCNQWTLKDSLFKVSDITLFNVTNISMNNLVLRGIDVAIFDINTLILFNVTGFSLTNANIPIPPPNFANNDTQVYAFRAQDMTTSSIHYLRNLTVSNVTANYFKLLKMSGTLASVNVYNFELSNSKMAGFFIDLQKNRPEDAIHLNRVVPLKVWNFNDLTITNNTFVNFQFLILGYISNVSFPCLQISESDEFKSVNAILINNTFQLDARSKLVYQARFIENQGYSINFINLTAINNTLSGYEFTRSHERYASILVQSSYFQDLNLVKSTFFGEGFSETKVECLDFAYYMYNNNTNDGWIYPTYRVTAIVFSSFSNIRLVQDSQFIDSSNPFLFATNNTFMAFSLQDSSSFITLGEYNPIPLDNKYYKYYKRNPTWESALFLAESKIYPNFIDTVNQSSNAAFMVRVIGNNFTDITINELAFIKLTSYNFPNTEVTLSDNQMMNFALIGSSVFQIDSVSRLGFSNNSFANTSGNGCLLTISDLQNEKFVNMSSNLIIAEQGPGILRLVSDLASLISINYNHISSSNFSRIAFIMRVLSNQGLIEFNNNTLINNLIVSDSEYYEDIGLIYLETPIEYPSNLVKFTENTFQRIGFIENGSFIKRISLSNLITVIIGKSSLIMLNCRFQDIQAGFDGSQMILSARDVFINNTLFDRIQTYGFIGAVAFVAQNINITYCNFTNNAGSLKAQGGVLYVEQNASLPAPIQLLMTNNTFINNTGGYGGVLYMKNSIMNLTAVWNYFNNNFGYSGTALEFYNATFTDFLLKDTESTYNLTHRVNSVGFLKFTLCSGRAILDNAYVQLSGRQDGELIKATLSPNLFINASLINVKTGETAFSNTSHFSTGLGPLAPPQDSPILLRRLEDTDNSSEVLFTQLGFLHVDGGTVWISNSNFDGYNPFERGVIEVSCLTNAVLIVDNSSFQNMQLAAAGADPQISNRIGIISLQASDRTNLTCDHSLTVSNSIFSDIVTNTSSCAINHRIEGQSSIKVLNSSFHGLQAQKGPAITSVTENPGTVIQVINSNFSMNKAYGYGGSIFSSQSVLDLQGCRFIDNQAILSGGAIYSEQLKNGPSIIESNTFENNRIGAVVDQGLHHGPNVAGNPHYIHVSFNPDNLRSAGLFATYDENHTLTLSNVTTYSFRNLTFLFELKDALNQTIIDDSPDVAVRMEFVVAALERQVSLSSDCYQNNFTGCKATPVLVEMYGTANYISEIHVRYTSREVKLNTTLYARHRDCLPGEVYNPVYHSCTYCEKGKFSVNPFYPQGDPKCLDCPSEGALCEGGSQMKALVGYWRNSSDSMDLRSCGDGGARCLAGYPGENTCAQGFKGPLCLQCDSHVSTGEIYVSTGELGQCGLCPAPWKVVVRGLLFFLVVFGYQIWFIFTTNKTNHEFYEALQNGKKMSTSGPYLRLLTTYNQIIMIVSSLDAGLVEFLNLEGYLSNPIASVIFSLDCVFAMMGLDSNYLIHYRILTFVLSPVIKFLMISLVACSIWKFKMNSDRWDFLVVVALSMILTEQPYIVQETMNYVNCKQLDPFVEAYFIRRTPNIQCWTTSYNVFLGLVVIPAVTFWGFIIPIYFYWKLKKDRQILDTKRMRVTFGTLYNEYKSQAYYWGVAVIMFKVLLIVSSNLMNENTEFKAVLILILLFGFKRFFAVKRPYYIGGLVIAERLAMYAYMSTVWFTLLFKGNPNVWVQYLCIAGIFLLNIIAIVFISSRILLLTKDLVLQTFKAGKEGKEKSDDKAFELTTFDTTQRRSQLKDLENSTLEFNEYPERHSSTSETKHQDNDNDIHAL